MVFQAQKSGGSDLRYPAGAGARLEAKQGLLIQIHYLNPTDVELPVATTIELERAEPESVKDHVHPLFFGNMAINVPPAAPPTTVSKTCTLAGDVELVMLTGHLHSHGLDFRATRGSADLYQTSDWHQPPMLVFDPPLALSAAEKITFSCTYASEPDRVLTFGDSMERDEMCNLVGAFIPRAGAPDGMLSCEDGAAAPGACLTCSQALFTNNADKACEPSAAKLTAFKTCSCSTDGCGASCADSSCGGGKPSDACMACISHRCAAERDGCFNDVN
jgi:hypothetical protein